MNTMQTAIFALALSGVALIAGCTVRASGGGGAAGPSSVDRGAPEWVPFEGEVVSEDEREVTLRDRSGATVVMSAGSVRSGPSGLELQVGGRLVALMVEGQDPGGSGLVRTEVGAGPEPGKASVPARSNEGRPASSFGCFGFYKYRCDDGTFAGFCKRQVSCQP